jgi:hypothetical protein
VLVEGDKQDLTGSPVVVDDASTVVSETEKIVPIVGWSDEVGRNLRKVCTLSMLTERSTHSLEQSLDVMTTIVDCHRNVYTLRRCNGVPAESRK